jgi:MSHA biogenesis protein MshM
MTMYLEHFGLREAPFKITPHTEFFFSGANRGETLEALIYAITSGEGIVKVTGEVGAGKTMLCRVLMERLPKSVETIYFAVPSLSPDELLATIANDLGVGSDGNITKLIRALQARLIEIHGSGKRVVALIDEAHAMPVETLDQIRLLSNLETSHEKLIQIVLFGQPELDQHLSMPNIRQLKERITHGFNLLPLPARDIQDYLNFRLRAAGYHGPDLFSKDALKLITDASEGLTRRINIYADKTLLAAYAAGTHTITTDHVRAAITDTQIVLPQSRADRNKRWLTVSASILGGAIIGFALGRYSAPTVVVPTAPTATAPSTSTQASDAATRAITRSADAAVTPAADTNKPVLDAAVPGSAAATAVTAKATNAIPVAPDAVASSGLPAPTPTVTAVATKVAATPPQPAATNGAAPDTDWLGKRLSADAARISTLAKERYSIQLMSADQRAQPAIEAFLRVASRDLNPDWIMVLPTGGADNPRVSVLYGNFDGATEAATELASLPARVSKFRPYARSFAAIRENVRAGAM